MLYEIYCTETGSLRTKDRTAPSKALTCEDACVVLLSKLAIHTVEVSDLTATYSDITCRNILVRTDHLPELKHECLAETHDLSV